MQAQDTEKEFEGQIKQHAALLHKVCRIYARTEADRQDLFQDIVLQLWKAYPRFKGEARFSTWLYRVALNTAITGLRRKKDFITPYEPDRLPTERSEESAPATEERWQQLYAAIAQLNEVEKAMVMLYLEERTYEEMEEILGIPAGTLRVKMSRIKDKLRQLTKTPHYGA